MKQCLVSLVSDQTIPNVLVAHHYQSDHVLFVTTEQMERKGKTDAILNCLRMGGLDYLDGRSHRVIVREDSLSDMEQRLNEWISNMEEEFEFVVNLTGGTKLMSIGVYQIFMSYGSTMVYVPIPKNEYLVVFPKRRPKSPEPLKRRLSVREYLAAYSFEVLNAPALESKKEKVEDRKETTWLLYRSYPKIKGFLKNLYKEMKSKESSRSKKRMKKSGIEFEVPFPVKELEADILTQLGFERIDGRFVKRAFRWEDYEYLRGGWLEERLYLAIRDTVPAESDVVLGIQYKDRDGNQNELDVVFTLDNRLHLVECKSLDAEEGEEGGGAASVHNFLYKLGALRQAFGLTPQAHLATTSENLFDPEDNLKQNLQKRAAQFNIQIVPLMQIPDLEKYFQEVISSWMGAQHKEDQGKKKL